MMLGWMWVMVRTRVGDNTRMDEGDGAYWSRW